jgi:hypothetical protein
MEGFIKIYLYLGHKLKEKRSSLRVPAFMFIVSGFRFLVSNLCFENYFVKR